VPSIVAIGGEGGYAFSFARMLHGIEGMFFVPIAHAQGVTNIGNAASKFFGMMLEIFTVLNWILLGMVQAVLNPDVIFGNAIGGVRPMEMILRQIWMLSRDIVNAIFAFLLILGAIMMIVQGKMETIKQRAPQFVIAVVLVNFSWFIPRVVLDISNVLQAVIYQIPAMAHQASSSNKCIEGKIDTDGDPTNGYEKDIPCKYVWAVRLFPPTPDKCGQANPPAGCPRPQNDPNVFPNWGRQYGQLVDIYYADWNKVMKDNGVRLGSGRFVPASGADIVVNGLAVNFAKLPNLSRLSLARAQNLANNSRGMMAQAQAYMQFFMYLVFNAVLSAAIGLLLLAMLAVFIIRIGVIWLCVAFMPFIFVGYAMKGSLGDMGVESFPNIKTYFLKYAFLPAMVAVPLAIGFTLLGFAPAVAHFSTNQPISIYGVQGVTGINTLHELIWLALTLGIIWVGTFKVLQSGNDIASGFVNGVQGFGQGALKAGVNTLGYAPVIPMGGGKQSLFGLRDIAKSATRGNPWQAMESLKLGGATTPPVQEVNVREAMQASRGDVNNRLNDMKNAGAGNTQELTKAMRDLIKTLVDTGKITAAEGQRAMTNPDQMRTVFKAAEAENLINTAERTNLESKFIPHMRTLNEAFRRLDMSVKAGMDKTTVNQKVVATLRTPGIDLDQFRKDLEMAKEAQFEAGSINAIDETLRKVNDLANAGKSNAEIADEIENNP
jgi:polyhydroxyalkanoate synthesis regulator phasin